MLKVGDEIGDILISLQTREDHLVTGNKLFRLLDILGDRRFGPDDVGIFMASEYLKSVTLPALRPNNPTRFGPTLFFA